MPFSEPTRYSVPNVKFIPKNIEQAREVLIDFPGDLEIELEIGVPLDAKTVEDLRLLFHLAARLGPDVPSRGLSYTGQD